MKPGTRCLGERAQVRGRSHAHASSGRSIWLKQPGAWPSPRIAAAQEGGPGVNLNFQETLEVPEPRLCPASQVGHCSCGSRSPVCGPVAGRGLWLVPPEEGGDQPSVRVGMPLKESVSSSTDLRACPRQLAEHRGARSITGRGALARDLEFNVAWPGAEGW